MIWGYIILAYLSLFALGIGDNVRGPLFPDILRYFQVSDTTGAFFFGVSSFCGFMSSLAVRFLLKRWSRVRTLQLAIFLMTVGLFGMGSASRFSVLLVFAGIFGAGLSIVGVVQNVLVSIGSAPAKRAQMLSGLHANYGVASLLAPLLVAWISSLAGTWRQVFWAAGVVPLLLLVGSFFWKEREAFEGEAPRGSLTPLPKQNFRDHGGQIFLAIALSFYVLSEIMVSTRLPLLVRRDLKVSLEESSYYLTGFFVFLLLGRLLFTFISLKVPLKKMLSLFLLLSAASMMLGLWAHPFFLVVSGLFMAPFYPLAVLYISNHYEASMDSALSYCMAVQAFMTVTMHGVVGFLTDLYGIHAALWVGPVALVISLVLLNSFEHIFKRAA